MTISPLSENNSPSTPCTDQQKKEECTPDSKQRHAQHYPPSTFKLMNSSTDPMQFCALDIHIIPDIEIQESSVKLRPKLDTPYYYVVPWHACTSFTSKPLHSYQARSRHNSHTHEFTIIANPFTQDEIHSSLQFLNHHNNRIFMRYTTSMDTYWR